MQRRLFIEASKKPGAYLNMIRGKEHSSMEVDDNREVREVNIYTTRMLKIKEKTVKHHKRIKGTVRPD